MVLPDLNHLLERAKRSDLAQSGQNICAKRAAMDTGLIDHRNIALEIALRQWYVYVYMYICV